jgi:hypothetical protein
MSGENSRMTAEEVYPYVRPSLRNQSLTREDVISLINELEQKNASEGKPRLLELTTRGFMTFGIPEVVRYINSKSGGRKSRRNRRRRNKSRKNRR